MSMRMTVIGTGYLGEVDATSMRRRERAAGWTSRAMGRP
jgi:hypothetical protein